MSPSLLMEEEVGDNEFNGEVLTEGLADLPAKRRVHVHERAKPSGDEVGKAAWAAQRSSDKALHESLGPAQAQGHARQMGWLYKLTCVVSGKGYVGQTRKVLLAKRMDGHRTAHRRPGCGCRLLNNAIRKYGWGSFRLEVLGRVPHARLDAEEARLIALHGTLQRNGYNILEGATNVPMHNPEVRAKRARTMLESGPRKAISDGVKRARKDRPDWDANQLAARRVRAEREREAKMAGMTEAEAEQYLKNLRQHAETRERQKARRTSC